jgi:hypothetical protein
LHFGDSYQEAVTMTARMKDCPMCQGLGAVPEDGATLGEALAEMREADATAPGRARFDERVRQASEQRRQAAERLQRTAG